MGTRVDRALAVLNGAIGDYLERSGNDLATPMCCVHRGKPLALTGDLLEETLSAPGRRVVLLVHGLMCTEAVWRFPQAGCGGEPRDYGSLLAADLGFTPFYLRYNTGLAVTDNGAALASLLEALVKAYPADIDEILVIAHSLGGLVVRSACWQAFERSCGWHDLLRRVILIDAPLLGSPLERIGRTAIGLLRAVDGPSTRLVADIGDLRSAAIKDLGDGDARTEKELCTPPDSREPELFVIAGSGASKRRLAAAFGELLVPLTSATAVSYTHLTLPTN